ncbi:hypothetical protein KIPB_004256 [Kipferlia bialata]|uniref:Uncharacterized protein n=1 Tax=Kipferlia bialata TaxID=797122 RepID=A0A9K3CTI4_9EUKA|nr:hypothetical protein KIPB_004256 [Kipferlia bialata]|eukprot:g4256.t1
MSGSVGPRVDTARLSMLQTMREETASVSGRGVSMSTVSNLTAQSPSYVLSVPHMMLNGKGMKPLDRASLAHTYTGSPSSTTVPKGHQRDRDPRDRDPRDRDPRDRDVRDRASPSSAGPSSHRPVTVSPISSPSTSASRPSTMTNGYGRPSARTRSAVHRPSLSLSVAEDKAQRVPYKPSHAQYKSPMARGSSASHSPSVAYSPTAPSAQGVSRRVPRPTTAKSPSHFKAAPDMWGSGDMKGRERERERDMKGRERETERDMSVADMQSGEGEREREDEYYETVVEDRGSDSESEGDARERERGRGRMHTEGSLADVSQLSPHYLRKMHGQPSGITVSPSSASLVSRMGVNPASPVGGFNRPPCQMAVEGVVRDANDRAMRRNMSLRDMRVEEAPRDKSRAHTSRQEERSRGIQMMRTASKVFTAKDSFSSATVGVSPVTLRPHPLSAQGTRDGDREGGGEREREREDSWEGLEDSIGSDDVDGREREREREQSVDQRAQAMSHLMTVIADTEPSRSNPASPRGRLSLSRLSSSPFRETGTPSPRPSRPSTHSAHFREGEREQSRPTSTCAYHRERERDHPGSGRESRLLTERKAAAAKVVAERQALSTQRERFLELRVQEPIKPLSLSIGLDRHSEEEERVAEAQRTARHEADIDRLAQTQSLQSLQSDNNTAKHEGAVSREREERERERPVGTVSRLTPRTVVVTAQEVPEGTRDRSLNALMSPTLPHPKGRPSTAMYNRERERQRKQDGAFYRAAFPEPSSPFSYTQSAEGASPGVAGLRGEAPVPTGDTSMHDKDKAERGGQGAKTDSRRDKGDKCDRSGSAWDNVLRRPSTSQGSILSSVLSSTRTSSASRPTPSESQDSKPLRSDVGVSHASHTSYASHTSHGSHASPRLSTQGETPIHDIGHEATGVLGVLGGAPTPAEGDALSAGLSLRQSREGVPDSWHWLKGRRERLSAKYGVHSSLTMTFKD